MQTEPDFRHRTFVLDNLRALPAGLLETVGTTFSILLAIRVFGAEWQWKALLVALPSVGMLLSLFVVQFVRRRGSSVNRTSALIWLVAAAGFALASISNGNFALYLAGMVPGLIGTTINVPLLSQIYRKHYPGRKRGRLFAISGVIRKGSAICAALLFGWLLSLSISHYPWLLGSYALACALMSLCVLGMEPVTLSRSNEVRLFTAFRHFKHDHHFRRLLISWMILGTGNLLCVALFVEYITNPQYGYALSEQKISLITTVIPETFFLLFLLLWGILFDRIHFYKLRILINLLFIGSMLFYFLGHGLWALYLGIAIHGVGSAGGNIIWSLWVTKFAQEQNVAEYMSVHTFLTGVRGVLAPFLAFPIALYLGPAVVAVGGSVLIVIASIYVLPGLKEAMPDHQ